MYAQTGRRIIFLVTASAILSGCAQVNRQVNRVVDWTKGGAEAGAEVDEGFFGNVTAYNTQVHTGKIQAQSALGDKFASSVQTTVNFAFNSARLSGTAKAIIAEQADFMRQFPEVRFSVYGHADAPGSNAYNERLGKRRAEAVVRHLTSLGISRNRLDALVSFGEQQPLVASNGREAANRRAVTEVGGFVSDNPLVLDGNYAAIVYRQYVGGGG